MLFIKKTNVALRTNSLIKRKSSICKGGSRFGFFQSLFKNIKFFLLATILILNFKTEFALAYSPSMNSPYGDDCEQLSDLVKEYKHNLYFIKKGSKNKNYFLERNKQIDSLLAQNAFQAYTNSFSLVAIPIKKELIEEKTYNPKIKDPNFRYVAKRYKIRYEILFSSESPKPIKDFNVLINDKKPEIKNGKIFLNYEQKWDETDTIEVRVQEKSNPKSIFHLEGNLKEIESEYSGKIDPIDIEEKIQSDQKEAEDKEKEEKDRNDRMSVLWFIAISLSVISYFSFMYFPL